MCVSQRFEEQLRELFQEFGKIAEVKTRYKAPPNTEGRSWALVTFTSVSSVRRVMGRQIIVPEELIEGTTKLTELVRNCPSLSLSLSLYTRGGLVTDSRTN